MAYTVQIGEIYDACATLIRAARELAGRYDRVDATKLSAGEADAASVGAAQLLAAAKEVRGAACLLLFRHVGGCATPEGGEPVENHRVPGDAVEMWAVNLRADVELERQRALRRAMKAASRSNEGDSRAQAALRRAAFASGCWFSGEFGHTSWADVDCTAMCIAEAAEHLTDRLRCMAYRSVGEHHAGQAVLHLLRLQQAAGVAAAVAREKKQAVEVWVEEVEEDEEDEWAEADMGEAREDALREVIARTDEAASALGRALGRDPSAAAGLLVKLICAGKFGERHDAEDRLRRLRDELARETGE